VPTYIILGRWTDRGIEQVDNVPQRERSSQAAASGAQVRHTVYFTLGEYDAISIIEAESEEEAAAYALEIGTHGNLRTTTMRAFKPDEFMRLLDMRPRWSPTGE
jgi:uncharacterized protein with GYD domain